MISLNKYPGILKNNDIFRINDLTDLEIVVPTPIPNYLNFYYFPDDKRIGVNSDGLILNVNTGKILKGSPCLKMPGRLYIHVTSNDKNRDVYQKHRIIARTFIGRPTRHRNKKYSILQVNHVDGDRKNNAIENLEWVTGKENCIHSHKSGLNSKDKQVLALNLKTNEIITFNSTKECADYFLIHRGTMWKHLNSNNCGKYHKNNYIFKFNNEFLWNILPENNLRELAPGERVVDFIITDLKTKQKIIISSYKDAAKYISLSTKNLYKKLNKKDFYKDQYFLIEKLIPSINL